MPRKRYTPEQIINSLKGSRSADKPGKHHKSSCKTSGYFPANLLQVEKRIWRNEDKPGKKAKGAGKGKCQAKETGSRSGFR
ncbi:unnamed protein product [marine sediment metagenome]|uniref:Uncharacterized protein n=1 Tax=marine sediment metagenome TaxID=412755 RepID=X1FBC8_9ZZZZ